MANRENFTADEWARLLVSPMVAGIAITAADPGGIWALLKEGMASSWALIEARQATDNNSLVKAVADAFSSSEDRNAARTSLRDRFQISNVAELKALALAELRAISGILDAKAPKDAPAFKDWLQLVAQRAAEAGKEGGFLGFGGVAVSDAERATLAEISAALDRPAAVPA